jgi:hypothetical protein
MNKTIHCLTIFVCIRMGASVSANRVPRPRRFDVCHEVQGNAKEGRPELVSVYAKMGFHTNEDGKIVDSTHNREILSGRYPLRYPINRPIWWDDMIPSLQAYCESIETEPPSPSTDSAVLV